MTLEEYKAKIAKIDKEYQKRKIDVNCEYTISNNSYKVGDIIEDHIGKGRIKEINWGFPFGEKLPCCIYFCDNLTKKGEIRKNEPTRNILQINIIGK